MSGWLALLGAGLLEIAWALGLKYSDGLTRFWPTAATAVAIVLSFALMALALRSLPFGTAYAVWTGIGAAGTAIVGMIWLGESRDPLKIVSLALLLLGIIGLRLTEQH
ncbi:MAG: DMT family transporter [Thermomicrobiales bacterium]